MSEIRTMMATLHLTIANTYLVELLAADSNNARAEKAMDEVTEAIRILTQDNEDL